MNPILQNNSVVFTSPSCKVYSLRDFNDYECSYQTAEKQFGEPNQMEFQSPVIQINSVSNIKDQVFPEKKSDELQQQKNYSSQDLRLNSHLQRDKQQILPGDRLLSENSSIMRKSLNNSINVNQLSPKPSPMRNSIVSMRSSITSETSYQKFGLNYLPSQNKQQENTISVPVQAIPSQANHVFLSEATKLTTLNTNKITFKDGKLTNNFGNISNITQSPINQEYLNKNFQTSATTTSITENKNSQQAISQQVLAIKQQGSTNINTTNNVNSSFSSIQQQFGDFLNQQDSHSANILNTHHYQYTVDSENSFNKYSTQILNENMSSTQIDKDAKQFAEIQKKMLFLISENEKLIVYNENLMKENKILKQGKDTLLTTHRLEIEDWKRKYDTSVENRDKEIRQLRDQVMRTELTIEERHRLYLDKEREFFEKEQNYLKKLQKSAQDILLANNSFSITNQSINKKQIEESNYIFQEELYKQQEQRIKDLEFHIVKVQNDNSKLVQTLASHDAIAREQLSKAHSDSLQKIEKILQNANNDKKSLEESLRNEILRIQSEKSFLQQELSSQKNESFQVSQIVTNDFSKLENDKYKAINRVNEIEMKCEKLIIDVQQLNILLAERLEQIQNLEKLNQELESQIQFQKTKDIRSDRDTFYQSEETKVLKIQLLEMEEKQAKLIEQKYEQEQIVEKYQQMTEQSQKMNTEYLQINESYLLKIQELEQSLQTSNQLVEKLDQKDHYITQLIQTIEKDKILYSSENEQLFQQLKNLEENHMFEIQQLKNSDLNCQKIQEQEEMIRQILQEKEQIRNELEQRLYQYEKHISDLNIQLEEEKLHNLEQIQSLKVEVSSKQDNFLQLEELKDMNTQLIEQMDIKEKAYQQTCLNFEERINQEIHNHTYQINMQLTNLKQAMRQLEEDNNQLKLDLDAHKREIDRQRIRYQDLTNEKEQIASKFERQIHQIVQQSDITIHNLKQEKEREMAFLQKEHQRMQMLLQEKSDIVSRLQAYTTQSSSYAQNNSIMGNQLLKENHMAKQSISSGLQTQVSSQNILKRNLNYNNHIHYEGQGFEQDENSNLLNTLKHQPSYYGSSLGQYQGGSLQMYAKKSSSFQTQQNHNISQQFGLQQTGQQASKYDTNIVEENDMLNKMILERCKNIVEGKITPSTEHTGSYASKKYPLSKLDN